MRKYENKGKGDQINFEWVGQVNFHNPPEEQRASLLINLLDKVKDEMVERLAQSLHRSVNVNLINLDKQLEPYQVANPWGMTLSVHASAPQPLPANTTIVDVFDHPEVNRKLLILGEPGSGKTTTLVELGQSLVQRAEQDVKEPIPVLVNLSNWKEPQQSIFEWLLKELSSKYGITQDHSKQWIESNLLLPLLDGLDEVATDRQELCAQKINDWLGDNLTQQPMGLVVCCRRREYEEIVRQHLDLKNSVGLLPLQDHQIIGYLTHLDFNGLLRGYYNNPGVIELLRKPLFLSIFGLVTIAGRFDAEKWQRDMSEAAQIEYLFDCYWAAVINRPLVDERASRRGIQSKTYGTKKLPNQRKIRRSLIFVAKALEQEKQTELLIEKMQPTWLRNKRQIWGYWLIAVLISVLAYGLPCALMIDAPYGVTSWLTFKLAFGLFFGLSFGLIYESLICAGVPISPAEAIQFSRLCFVKREIALALRKVFILSLSSGLVIGLLYVSEFKEIGLIVAMLAGLSNGLTNGLVSGLGFWVFPKLNVWLIADIEDRISPNQGIKNSRQNMFILTTIALLIAILLRFTLKCIHMLGAGMLPFRVFAPSIGYLMSYIVIIAFITGGGRALLERIVLAWNGYAPYRYDKLLDYCTERLLLQRIGGCYRFMHPLLQKYFAKMPLD
jgi:GTPase SAR1 family protein